VALGRSDANWPLSVATAADPRFRFKVTEQYSK
jgi:hypothetical protein